MMQEHRSQASHAPASQPTQCIQGREVPTLSYFEFELREFNIVRLLEPKDHAYTQALDVETN
jgi:hypothetical protein